jgi:selenocysteine lyase/cysteine desulfurase
MPFDVAATRAQFPSLASDIAHFDGPGGTQAPAVVGEAIARTVTGPLSNRGIGVASEQNAEDAIFAFRIALADLLAASPAEIVYGRSATQIAYDFSRHLAKTWAPGRGRRHSARPRRQRPSLDPGRRCCRRHRALAPPRPDYCGTSSR